MRSLLFIIIVFTAASIASAANDKGTITNFSTGEHIVVRSLAVEGDILWVGTSNGVMKVNSNYPISCGI